jgi:hypothetical protein
MMYGTVPSTPWRLLRMFLMSVMKHMYLLQLMTSHCLLRSKKFVYAVLESKVLTDCGKAIIRDHEHNFDAQKEYKKLKDYHLKSTKAKVESSVLLSYITSAKLGDGTWNGTTEAFVIKWQNQVRLYKKHGSSADQF